MISITTPGERDPVRTTINVFLQQVLRLTADEPKLLSQETNFRSGLPDYENRQLRTQLWLENGN